jgi:hypothetical protein
MPPTPLVEQLWDEVPTQVEVPQAQIVLQVSEPSLPWSQTQ